MIKKEFTAAADGTWAKPENGPDPAKVAEAGIKTPGSLAYLARQHPEPPKQSYEIDQEALRQAALTQERARKKPGMILELPAIIAAQSVRGKFAWEFVRVV